MSSSTLKKPILWCLPYAGGNSSIFHRWPTFLDDIVEVRPVVLPGRESRFSEPAKDSLQTLADEILLEISQFADRNWALFGHSMGGALAWEIAIRIENLNIRENLLLLAISGRASPDLKRICPPIHQEDDLTFIQSLGKLGGTPSEILAERELMDLLLPTIRADFKAIETWIPSEGILSKTPILACGGILDKESEPSRIMGWKERSAAGFSLAKFEGDHFFIQSHQAQLLNTLREALRKSLND